MGAQPHHHHTNNTLHSSTLHTPHSSTTTLHTPPQPHSPTTRAHPHPNTHTHAPSPCNCPTHPPPAQTPAIMESVGIARRRCSTHHVARRRSTSKRGSLSLVEIENQRTARQLSAARARYDVPRSMDDAQINVRRLAREWTPTRGLRGNNAPTSVSQVLQRRALASTTSLKAL